MRVGIIYKAKSPSGKVYIGQTRKGFNHRVNQHYHSAYNTKNKSYDSKICKAIRKYNKSIEWFILYDKIPLHYLDIMEIWCIANHNSFIKGYNSTTGGNSGRSHSPMSDTTRKKISATLTGIRRSEETIIRMSQSKTGKNNPNFGKKMSKETRKKVSESLKGTNNYLYGKPMPQSKKDHLSKINKGKILSEEIKNKMSVSRSGSKNHNSKLTWESVRDIRTKYATKKYTYKELAQEYNVSFQNIWMIIKLKAWIE